MTEYSQQQPAVEKNATSKIITVRGQKAILDSDLAGIYGVETKILNRAVSRNRARFPEDFAFRLTIQEFANLRFQNGTSRSGWLKQL